MIHPTTVEQQKTDVLQWVPKMNIENLEKAILYTKITLRDRAM